MSEGRYFRSARDKDLVAVEDVDGMPNGEKRGRTRGPCNVKNKSHVRQSHDRRELDHVLGF